MQLLYVILLISSDKLLNYLMLDPEFIEVKMEALKAVLDIHFLALPDLMTIINCFDNWINKMHFLFYILGYQ